MLKQPLWPYLIAQSSPNSGAILRLDDDQPSIDETAPAKIIRQLPSPIDLPPKCLIEFCSPSRSFCGRRGWRSNAQTITVWDDTIRWFVIFPGRTSTGRATWYW